MVSRSFYVGNSFAHLDCDNCAALNTGRNFGGVELDGKEYNKSLVRLEAYCDAN